MKSIIVIGGGASGLMAAIAGSPGGGSRYRSGSYGQAGKKAFNDR